MVTNVSQRSLWASVGIDDSEAFVIPKVSDFIYSVWNISIILPIYFNIDIMVKSVDNDNNMVAI